MEVGVRGVQLASYHPVGEGGSADIGWSVATVDRVAGRGS